MTPIETQVQSAYSIAKERYAALGVDTDSVLKQIEKVAISLHCWQGDDVGGFENPGGELTGGIAATGNYPGKARTADELRQDLDVVYSLLPGSHRLNLHAIYLESDTKVERNAIEPKHFMAWKDWAQSWSTSMITRVSSSSPHPVIPTPAARQRDRVPARNKRVRLIGFSCIVIYFDGSGLAEVPLTR